MHALGIAPYSATSPFVVPSSATQNLIHDESVCAADVPGSNEIVHQQQVCVLGFNEFAHQQQVCVLGSKEIVHQQLVCDGRCRRQAAGRGMADKPAYPGGLLGVRNQPGAAAPHLLIEPERWLHGVDLASVRLVAQLMGAAAR